MSDLRGSLLPVVDDILSIRQNIGAQLASVSFITRTWTGTRIGDGTSTDKETVMNPLPQIKDFSHDIRVTEAGAVKQGDLILIGISQNQYPDEDSLKTQTQVANIERFIKVGKHYYHTIHVKQKLITWDIHVRKIDQDITEAKGN